MISGFNLYIDGQGANKPGYVVLACYYKEQDKFIYRWWRIESIHGLAGLPVDDYI